jgi:hypothetical protein
MKMHPLIPVFATYLALCFKFNAWTLLAHFASIAVCLYVTDRSVKAKFKKFEEEQAKKEAEEDSRA